MREGPRAAPHVVEPRAGGGHLVQRPVDQDGAPVDADPTPEVAVQAHTDLLARRRHALGRHLLPDLSLDDTSRHVGLGWGGVGHGVTSSCEV